LSLYVKLYLEILPVMRKWNEDWKPKSLEAVIVDAFMKDYFSLDIDSLTLEYTHNSDWAQVFPELYVKIPHFEFLGSRMIGTPEFKEYYRRHVDEWRDERDML
jgi:hypothetical protein